MIDDDADRRIHAKLVSRGRAPGPSNNESYCYSSKANEFAEVEVETAALRDAKRRRMGRFLKGPIPMRDIAAAARLSGKALAVYLAVHHRVALTRSAAVKLPASLMRELGVDKDSKARALRQLEAIGLIAAQRQKGRSPIIMLKREEKENE